MRFFTLLATSILLVGCASGISNVSHGNWHQEINDSELNSKVIVQNVAKRRLNDLLNVEVRLRNLTDDVLDLEYRFMWLDDGGFNLETTPWMAVTLSGKQTKAIEQIAHFKNASDFKFEYREIQQ